jgi:hypothetical protein
MMIDDWIMPQAEEFVKMQGKYIGYWGYCLRVALDLGAKPNNFQMPTCSTGTSAKSLHRTIDLNKAG